MIDFKIRIAGQVAAITAMYDSTQTFCKDYLCDEPPDFTVCMTQKDLAFEREKSMREDQLEGKPAREFPDWYLEIIAVQRKVADQLLDYDVLLFHGSVVAVDGVGYLFTATSGTGKSTHTRLWRELLGDRAVMINDDKPFLRIAEDGVIAYGAPWNGKHALGANVSAPLKAICILQRGMDNQIAQMDARNEVRMLLQQSNRPVAVRKMPKYMELVDRLAKYVKLYRMSCNMELEAAQIAYETMSQ